MADYIVGQNASGEDVLASVAEPAPAKLYGTRDPLGTPTEVVAEIDNVGPWLVTVDAAHHQIHEGDSFTVSRRYAGVGATGIVHMLIYVPKTAIRPHITFEASSSKAYLMELYEAPTKSAQTGSLTIYNRNRSSDVVSTISAWSNPTISADGNLLAQVIVGSTTGNVKLGGTSRGTQEFSLAASTYYNLKMTALGATATFCVTADFYQETISV